MNLDKTKKMKEEKFMKIAIELALENIDKGGGPFASVIVRNGEIIASGANRVTLDNDPTAHGEVNAIRNACKELNTFILDDCELYTSSEPCPMCLSAIYWARIKKVYYACSHSEASKAGFDDSFIYKQLNLEPEKREISSEQIQENEAKKVFEKWVNLEDKTEY